MILLAEVYPSMTCEHIGAIFFYKDTVRRNSLYHYYYIII